MILANEWAAFYRHISTLYM